MRWLWSRKALGPEEQAVTDSIKALKTLRVKHGRVSIDAREVIDRPGYKEARRRAGSLIHRPPTLHVPGEPRMDWAVVDELGVENWLMLVATALRRSRSEGTAYLDAIENLKHMQFERPEHE